MRSSTILLFGGLMAVSTIPLEARGAAIVQYNFNGASSTETLSQYETPTSSASNVTTNNFTLGSTTTPSEDNGVTTYYSSPGPNYLSVENTATSDNGYYIDFIVTANAGYQFTPTSVEVVGGAGGSSATRSFFVSDSADTIPTSVTGNSGGGPTVTGGTDVGGDAFTAIRASNPLEAMNDFTVSLSDGAQTSYEVRIFFDTQANVDKNIDLSSITLNGTVSPVPEPASLLGLGTLAGLALVRRRSGR